MMATMSGLRIVFMGTPAFAVPVLQSTERVADHLGASIVAVSAGPDRPAGRGRKLRASPVKSYAESRDVEVLTPERVTRPEEIERFEALDADLVVVAAYGLLLPGPILHGPTHGAVNLHPSLLPRYRGAAPVAAAILAGDAETGVSLMRMDEGLDTGRVIVQSRMRLAGNERAPALTERLFALGAALVEEQLPRYLAGELVPVLQDEDEATIIKRFAKEDGTLDWSRPAVELERRVRALDPWPGTATTWQGRRLDVLEATVLEAAVGRPTGAVPGTVVGLAAGPEGGVGVATGADVLLLVRMRLEGRRENASADFVRGHPGFVGSVLPS